MAKRTKTELAALKLLRKRVLLETACIRFTEKQLAAMRARPRHLGSSDTEEIREATRLYRDTWVLPIIDALISGDTEKLKKLADWGS